MAKPASKLACSLLLLLCACSSGRHVGLLADGHQHHAIGHEQDQAATQFTEELSAMRREMADMQSQRPQAQAMSLASSVRHDVEARDNAQRVQMQRAANIEAAFRSEKVNLRWSRATMEILRTAFEGDDEVLRGQVRSIECRSQSCRIEIDDSADASLQKHLPFIAERLAPMLPNMSAAQSAQSPTTLLYFSRSRETA
jgi:hypothetical protein